MATAKNVGIQRGFALWRTAMRWQRAVDATLAPFELTHTQYLVLASASSVVEEGGDTATQRAIAGRAGLDEATTSRLVRSLAERGLLDRAETLGDKRAWRVILTRRGRALLQRATPRLEVAARGFFVDKSPGDHSG
jgi:DNA-binding MarR family transcriptional regulator